MSKFPIYQFESYIRGEEKMIEKNNTFPREKERKKSTSHSLPEDLYFPTTDFCPESVVDGLC